MMHTMEGLMFQKLPILYNQMLSKDIIDIVMITKHVLYRFRFRENVQRYFTHKLVTMNLVLELKKVVSIRQGQIIT